MASHLESSVQVRISNNVYDVSFRSLATGYIIAPTAVSISKCCSSLVVVLLSLDRVVLVFRSLSLSLLTMQSPYYSHPELPSLLAPSFLRRLLCFGIMLFRSIHCWFWYDEAVAVVVH